MAMGQINLPEGSLFKPGDTKELEIIFLAWPELRSEIRPGREWRIQEGGQLVGVGTILAVLDA